MSNNEARYLLKLFNIVNNSELEEKNSKEFQKMLQKLTIIDRQITTSDKYHEDMKEYQTLLSNLEKEEVEENE